MWRSYTKLPTSRLFFRLTFTYGEVCSPRHLQVYQLCDWDRSQLCFWLILTRAMWENHPKCCTNATEISQSPRVPPTMRAMRGQHRLFLPWRSMKFQRPTPFFDRRKPKEVRWNRGLSSCLSRNFLKTFIFSNLTQKGPPTLHLDTSLILIEFWGSKCLVLQTCGYECVYIPYNYSLTKINCDVIDINSSTNQTSSVTIIHQFPIIQILNAGPSHREVGLVSLGPTFEDPGKARRHLHEPWYISLLAFGRVKSQNL